MRNKNNTKRIILTVSLTLSFFFVSLDKNIKAQDLGLGIKAGLDISTQLTNFRFETGDLELNLNPDFSNGYHFSLIYRNRIAKNFRLQIEPSFLRLGTAYKESFTFRNFEFQTKSETKLSYLHLPLLLELTTTPPDLEEFPKPWEETTYHATLGFYGSYLLDATFSGVNSGTPIGVDFEEQFSEDVTSQLNEYDAGIIVGGGFEYGYLNKFGIDARLMLGFINSNEPTETEFDLNNLSIQFSMYHFF